MKHKSKFIGSVLIVAGTAFGAGMLALPLVASRVGFLDSTVLLVFLWAVMLYTAFLVLEVNLGFDLYKNSFVTMASQTLGIFGKLVTWLGFLLLLYSLISAYIAGDASVLSVFLKEEFSLNAPLYVCAILFTAVFGGIVFWSTKAVDIVNRGLFTVKGVLIILAFAFLFPHVNFGYIEHGGSASFVWMCAPIFLCSFGFQHVIPSIVNYVGKDPKLIKKIIVIGITLPLIIYIFWLFVSFGVVPFSGTHGSLYLSESKSVGGFIGLIIRLSHSNYVKIFLNAFSNVALSTSFLGVSLGLFDLLADGLKRVDTRVGRMQTSLLVFVPPLLFAIFYFLILYDIKYS